MSSIGIAQDRISFAPRIIAAHADHRRSDFVFQRTQSLNMRDAPWERRIKPLKTWAEIGAYWAMAVVATGLVVAMI